MYNAYITLCDSLSNYKILKVEHLFPISKFLKAKFLHFKILLDQFIIILQRKIRPTESNMYIILADIHVPSIYSIYIHAS